MSSYSLCNLIKELEKREAYRELEVSCFMHNNSLVFAVPYFLIIDDPNISSFFKQKNIKINENEAYLLYVEKDNFKISSSLPKETSKNFQKFKHILDIELHYRFLTKPPFKIVHIPESNRLILDTTEKRKYFFAYVNHSYSVSDEIEGHDLILIDYDTWDYLENKVLEHPKNLNLYLLPDPKYSLIVIDHNKLRAILHISPKIYKVKIKEADIDLFSIPSDYLDAAEISLLEKTK